ARGTSDLEMLAMIEPAADQPAIGYKRFGNAQGITSHFVTISAPREMRRAYRVHAPDLCYWTDATIAQEDSLFQFFAGLVICLQSLNLFLDEIFNFAPVKDVAHGGGISSVLVG